MGIVTILLTDTVITRTVITDLIDIMAIIIALRTIGTTGIEFTAITDTIIATIATKPK
jgi:hypothetical protein